MIEQGLPFLRHLRAAKTRPANTITVPIRMETRFSAAIDSASGTPADPAFLAVVPS